MKSLDPARPPRPARRGRRRGRLPRLRRRHLRHRRDPGRQRRPRHGLTASEAPTSPSPGGEIASLRCIDHLGVGSNDRAASQGGSAWRLVRRAAWGGFAAAVARAWASAREAIEHRVGEWAAASRSAARRLRGGAAELTPAGAMDGGGAGLRAGGGAEPWERGGAVGDREGVAGDRGHRSHRLAAAARRGAGAPAADRCGPAT